MINFTKCFLGCLLLGTVGSLQAQSLTPSEHSEDYIQRRIEAFENSRIDKIPLEGTSLYKEGARSLTDQIGNFAKTYPLSSNPRLEHAVRASRSNSGKEDLIISKELDMTWGTVRSIEDGKQYLFTQELEKSTPSGSYMSYYRSVTYKIYNDDFEELKSFKVASADTTYSFSLSSDISTKVFNSDSNWEFLVQIHGFVDQQTWQGPKACRDTLVIVNEESERLNYFNWAAGAIVDKVKSGYSYKYNFGVFEPYYGDDVNDRQRIMFYDPKKVCREEYGSLPEPLFSYDFQNHLVAYSEGPVFNLTQIDNEAYYVTTHYERPFFKDRENSEVDKDNRFVVKMFDTSFNLFKEIKIPLFGLDENEYSTSYLGLFPDYMITRNVFNSDDKFEFVYGMNRYQSADDSESFDIYLVNEDGELIKEMFKGIGKPTKLQYIPNCGDEYAVPIGTTKSAEAISMYRMPEMKENVRFNAIHNGELLSFSFDRVSVGNTYQYVFGLGRPEIADNTVYGGIAYYDQTGKMTRRVRINIGEKAVLFMPVITGMMNPYVFIPDEKTEYLFFVKSYTDDYLGYVDSFGIANEDGILYSWGDENEFLAGAGILSNQDDSEYKNLYVSLSDKSNQFVNTIFYELPLKKCMLTGEGTEKNPYKISNPAELDMVRIYPDAWFEMTNDIDMASFTGVYDNGFNPIPSFTGHFDGNNHIIRNLTVNASPIYSGLFGEVAYGGMIENLQMENVVWRNMKSFYWGTVVGYLNSGSLFNCHVIGDLGKERAKFMESSPSFGGLVGQATVSSFISNCSFIGNIYAAGALSAGGISGGLMTNSVVVNCLSNGNIVASNNIGGIVGEVRSGSTVENCYSNMNIDGLFQIGGVVGFSEGIVKNNYSAGNVIGAAREGENWVQNSGGIAGGVTKGFMGECKVMNNIALNEMVVSPLNYARVAYAEVDDLLSDNYALSSMLIGPDSENLATADESDETTVALDKIHGKSVAKEELDLTFYETLGWSFGTDSISPWVMTEHYPRLWYEFLVRGIKLENNELTLAKGTRYVLKPEIYPADATNKNVRYASSDMKVATVSATGEITARNAGVADITVTTEEGTHKAVCHVTVIIPVEQVIISEENLKLGIEEMVALDATVLPEDATNKNIVWVSEDMNIAYMLENNVVGINPGTTRIVAMTEDGMVSDTCLVTVVAPVEDLYLEETMITLDKKHPTHQLVAHLVPETAEANLIWESADTRIAEVDQNGLVKGYRKGEVIVSVHTDDNKFSADCLVEVVEDIDVHINRNRIEDTKVFVDNGLIVVSSEAVVSSVRISDVAGRIVYADLQTVGSRIEVSVSGWQTGSYLVEILYNTGDSCVYKIVL